MFWEVKTADGKAGFVSIMKVNRKADAGGESLSNSLRKAIKDGRDDKEEVNGSRSRSAVMGVRGLSPAKQPGWLPT